MTYSMDTSQLMNKVALVAGIEIMHELRKTNFHSPRATWPWLLTAECSPLIAAKANSESPIRHHSLGWSVSFLVTGWLHCTASIMEVSAFLFYWNTYPGYDFLSECKASAKTTIHEFTCFIYCHGILYHIASYLGIHSIANSKRNVAIGPCSRNSLILQLAW